MATKFAKPEKLDDLKRRLELIYSNAVARRDRWRSIYNKKFKNTPNVPDGVPIFESSTGRNLVDNLADQIRTDTPRVVFKVAGTSQKAQKQKELMEMLGQALIERISYEGLIDPMRQAKLDLLLDGAACIKYTVDIDNAPPPPKRDDYNSNKAFTQAFEEWKKTSADYWYWNVRPVDVNGIYPAPVFTKRPPYMLEVQQRRIQDVAHFYPNFNIDKYIKNGKWDKNGLIDWLEYWDDDHYIVEVDNQRIIDKPNPYGFVPYEFKYNGLGRLDKSGDLGLLGEGILEGIVGELEAEVRIKTAQDAQWQLYVFPRLIVAQMSAAKARAAFMKGPGAIIEVPDMTQKPEWLVVAAPNPTMAAFAAEIKASIAARFPPSLTQRPAGVEAAVHQALLLGQALKPLLPVKTALNQLATGLVEGMVKQVVKMRLFVNVYGTKGKQEASRMVGPDDITAYNFDVKYEATDPAEDDRKLLTGLALMRVPGLISRRSFREKFAKALGLNNEEEEEQISVERIIDLIQSDPFYLQLVFEEYAAMQQEKQLEQVAQQMRAELGEGAEQFVPGARERTAEELAGGIPVRETGRTVLAEET